MLLLGVASRSRPRTDHKAEKERLPTATERLTVLGSLGSWGMTALRVMPEYLRPVWLAMVGWLWLARMPTVTASSKLWATIKMGKAVCAWPTNGCAH